MDPELYHWGIKGMRWGIRRYQNPDGTLTPEGRARYIRSDGSLTRRARRKGVEKILSTEDLKIVNNRLDLERQYRNANGHGDKKQEKQKSEKSSGISKTITDIITSGVKTIADEGSRKMAKKLFSDKPEDRTYRNIGAERTRHELNELTKKYKDFNKIPYAELQRVAKEADVINNATGVADGRDYQRSKK